MHAGIVLTPTHLHIETSVWVAWDSDCVYVRLWLWWSQSSLEQEESKSLWFWAELLLLWDPLSSDALWTKFCVMFWTKVANGLDQSVLP